MISPVIRSLSSKLSIALLLGMGVHAQSVRSEVFRCVDESGRAQYTNVRADVQGRNCTVVQREVSVVPANAPAPISGRAPSTASNSNVGSSGSLRVDPNTQRSRDDGRRKILEDELAQEQRSLSRAKEDLATQEQTRGGDERNYQKVLDRLKPYQEAVDRHERNISALQKEMSNLR